MTYRTRKWSTILSFSLLAIILATGPLHARKRSISSITQPATTDEGTRLSVSLDTPSVSCSSDGAGGEVTLLYSVVSTGSADSADLMLVIGGVESSLGTIASGTVEDGGDWTSSGRTKTAEGSVSQYLANGEYSVQICATQSGSQGREPKSACSEPVTVNIDCLGGETSCPVAEFYGELVSNPQMCTGNGPVMIQIQFRGDFGSFATLDISGPSGYHLSEVVSRNGESCTYHHNWNLGRHPESGVYTVSVNGGALVYGVTLSCRN